MAVAQSTYSTTLPVGLAGQIANGETSNRISRTIESAAGVGFGQPVFRGTADHGVVVGATFAATGAGSEAAGNVGTGTITDAPTIAAGAKQGRYQAVLLATSATAKFQVLDPDGVLIGVGNVATEFSGGGLTFTIANAGAMTIGDTFYVDVTYTANVKFMGLTILSHSLQVLAGGTADLYAQYANVNIMTEGVMWVTAGASVTDGSDVYWNPATGRYTSTTTHIRIPNAKFDGDGTNGNLVKVALKSRLIN